MFCIACPDAPFTRLSMAQTIIAVLLSGFALAPIWQKFEPLTQELSERFPREES